MGSKNGTSEDKITCSANWVASINEGLTISEESLISSNVAGKSVSLEEIKDYLFQGGAHREVIVTISTEIVLENKYE